MAIDEALEERVADHRGRTRQNKAVPWLIRDPDGSIWPNTPLLAKKQNMRPYHGAIDASAEERKRYLQGLQTRRRVVVSESANDAPPFDLAKCTKDELIAFAEEEYGYTLDPTGNLHSLRAEFAKVAGVEYVIPANRGRGLGKTAAASGADTAAGGEGG